MGPCSRLSGEGTVHGGNHNSAVELLQGLGGLSCNQAGLTDLGGFS